MLWGESSELTFKCIIYDITKNTHMEKGNHLIENIAEYQKEGLYLK